MSLPWQEIAVTLIVLAAAVYLARRGYLALARRRAGGCGGCSTCPGGSSTGSTTLISSEILKRWEPPAAHQRGRSG